MADSQQKIKVLKYIVSFLQEDHLDDVVDALYSQFPGLENETFSNIPYQALYSAVELLEANQYREYTKDARALMKYYDNILTPPLSIPHPISTIKTADVKTTGPLFHQLNITCLKNHPFFPHFQVSCSAGRDLVITYLPQTYIDNEASKSLSIQSTPGADSNASLLQYIVLDRLTLPGVGLSCDIKVLQVNDIDIELFIAVGLINGQVVTVKATGLTTEHLFTNSIQQQGQEEDKKQDHQQHMKDISLPQIKLTAITTSSPHGKYVTQIKWVDTFQSSNQLEHCTGLTTASHDCTVKSLRYDQSTRSYITTNSVEYKGKIEALTELKVPQSFIPSHPSYKTPPPVELAQLILPTTTSTRTENKLKRQTLRAINKEQYPDDFQYIEPPIAFTTDQMLILSVRNDPYLYIINSITLEPIDRINVNVLGDEHISFTVLSLAVDHQSGVIFAATDNIIIIAIDSCTKQHVRRYYCTDNNEMSTPILQLHYPNVYYMKQFQQIVDNDTKLMKIYTTFLSLCHQQLVIKSGDDDDNSINTNTILDTHQNKYENYPFYILCSTQNNSIKVYHPQSQQEVVELTGPSKNIKGICVLPYCTLPVTLLPQPSPTAPTAAVTIGSNNSTQHHNDLPLLISSGFDKNISLYQ